jgi:hypothetical protein
MIEFMLLAAPRSGTAWAANWLTTDASLCLHEPLYQQTHAQLDARTGTRQLGIACTASALLNVNRHPARKVILHRDAEEVRTSMEALGIPGDYDFSALDNVEGKHYHWSALFEDPAPIYEYLLEYPFDPERHQLLKGMNIQNRQLIEVLQRGECGAPADA